MTLRPEAPGDAAAIHALNVQAFGSRLEADLVDALRRDAHPWVSLVAKAAGQVVGHIMFTPVTLPEHPRLKVMGLAPMAVAPAHRRQGLGSALVRAGLESVAALGYEAVVVLGHPEYYPRFGFVPASRFGIRSEYDAPDEAFMALELVARSLEDAAGTARYHAAFASAGA